MMGFMATLPEFSPASLSSVSLASVLDQSVDCVKLIGLDGDVHYMNANGLCSMEIGDFDLVRGKQWVDLWPEASKAQIRNAYLEAGAGEIVRFRAFCPTMKGSPRWWDVTVSAVLNEDAQHAGYMAISRDVTENQQRLDTAIITADELRHRLSNAFAVMCAVMNHYARGDDNRVAFAEQMLLIFAAMGRAKTLFANMDAPRHVDDLTSAVLSPFGNPECSITIERLPAATVGLEWANAIALVLGELSVNSTKHGALGSGGSIVITGKHTERGFTLLWTEKSKKVVQCIERDGGQGMQIMQRAMQTRGGTLDMRWRRDGLTAELAVPL
jgi:PAS domain S-box-containing protein